MKSYLAWIVVAGCIAGILAINGPTIYAKTCVNAAVPEERYNGCWDGGCMDLGSGIAGLPWGATGNWMYSQQHNGTTLSPCVPGVEESTCDWEWVMCDKADIYIGYCVFGLYYGPGEIYIKAHINN